MHDRFVGLRRILRWLATPARRGPLHETWTCPKCGRSIEVPSTIPTGVRNRPGVWGPPGDNEIVAACEKANGPHTQTV
jgi:hypothetical protein